MGPDEDMLYLRKELATKGSRVLPESPNNVFRNGTDSPMCSLSTENMLSGDGDRFVKLKLDERWIIDPKVLFVGSKLGEGAHGKVYEGKYHNVNVAVKIIQPGETPEDIAKSKSRFAREVAMLSKVQHKNLVKFIGACEEPMALVTELLSGQSLRKYLLSQRPQQMDIALAVSFALDIAQVMDCLHANGIIHRDLKPDNLLLTGDQKTVKLVDFGLAREESVTEMMTAETGTYRWMAPELYSTVTLRQGEKKHYNHKVDVYSFAIVLWELLTNRMPFEGMSNLQAAYAAAFKNVRPTLADYHFPQELVFILQSCWAEDPNVRPNFAQVVRMLTAFLSSLPSPEKVPPPHVFASKIITTAKESSSSSSAIKDSPRAVVTDESTSLEGKSKLFQCFGHCFFSSAAGSLA